MGTNVVVCRILTEKSLCGAWLCLLYIGIFLINFTFLSSCCVNIILDFPLTLPYLDPFPSVSFFSSWKFFWNSMPLLVGSSYKTPFFSLFLRWWIIYWDSTIFQSLKLDGQNRNDKFIFYQIPNVKQNLFIRLMVSQTVLNRILINNVQSSEVVQNIYVLLG